MCGKRNHYKRVGSLSPKSKTQPILYWKEPARWFLAVVALSILVLFWFRANPSIELAYADSFFLPYACSDGVTRYDGFLPRCGAFVLRASEGLNWVRDVGFRIPVIAMILLVAWAFWPPAPGQPKTVADLSLPSLGILSVLLGPLLTVNMILKPVFGRPRPGQVDWFGGEWTYTLPGELGGQCSGNCSFASGEAASAFWMLWIIPFLPPRWRWVMGIAILLLATGVSALRMAFGGHFLSDVVMGGFVSLIAVCASAWFLQSRFGNAGQRWICGLYNSILRKTS